jgi:hypothetical protein
MLSDRAVIRGKAFRAARNRIDDIAARIFLRIWIDGGRWGNGCAGIYSPARARALAEEVGCLAEFEDGYGFGGARGGFECNVAPGCDLARGSDDGVDAEEVS